MHHTLKNEPIDYWNKEEIYSNFNSGYGYFSFLFYAFYVLSCLCNVLHLMGFYNEYLLLL